jgi:hypothetical protein
MEAFYAKLSAMTERNRPTVWPFKVIEGGKAEQDQHFTARVSELLDEPNGREAWQKLRALARTKRQAANTQLAVVPPDQQAF